MFHVLRVGDDDLVPGDERSTGRVVENARAVACPARVAKNGLDVLIVHDVNAVLTCC